MSKADDLTEKSLNGLEKKIKSEYSKAYQGMKARYDEYINGSDEIVNGKTIHHQSLAERLAKEEEAYKAGKYTDAEWKSYQITQIQRGERYNAMCDDLAKRMTSTNEVASAYINDKTPSIYSLNANYQAYEIGKGLEGVSFTMYDEQAVKNMVSSNGNFTEFRTIKVDPVRDYSWNTQQINSALTSGILQGKSVDQLADSFMGVMKRNRNSAIRNARTAYTSAQNGGRMSGLRQAKAQGINVQKQWLSAHDGRVRDSHAMLNGQIRDIEERFDNGLLFPADSDGIPAEVYNCRCTLTYIYPEYDNEQSSEIYASEALSGETYQQFVKRMSKASEDENSFENMIINQNKKRNDERLYKKDTAKITPAKNTTAKKATATKANTKKKAKATAPDTSKMTDQQKRIIEDMQKKNIEYNEALKYSGSRSADEIIKIISGGDQTKGSCMSLGYTYIGEKCGFDVRDFRDGNSRLFIALNANNRVISKFVSNGKVISHIAGSQLSACNQLAKQMEVGKEYCFVGGKHCSIMRKSNDGNLEFLELQSATDSGWHTISKKISRRTGYENWFCNCTNSEFFKRRFGASDKTTYAGMSYMFDVDDVDKDYLKEILGFINTDAGKEVKGISGSIK